MPKKIREQLNPSQVKAFKAKHAGTYTDGETLTLRVEKSGSKHWVQRLTINGKQRNIGLGGYPTVGLAEARKKGPNQPYGPGCGTGSHS